MIEAPKKKSKQRKKYAAIMNLYKDAAGEHRWRCKSSNGQIVADSGEGYTTKDGARKAAHNFVKMMRGNVRIATLVTP